VNFFAIRHCWLFPLWISWREIIQCGELKSLAGFDNIISIENRSSTQNLHYGMSCHGPIAHAIVLDRHSCVLVLLWADDSEAVWQVGGSTYGVTVSFRGISRPPSRTVATPRPYERQLSQACHAPRHWDVRAYCMLLICFKTFQPIYFFWQLEVS